MDHNPYLSLLSTREHSPYTGVPPLGVIERFDVETNVPIDMIAKADMACVAVSLVFVALRLYLRFRRKIINLEDLFIVCAWLFFALSMSLEVAASYMGKAVTDKYAHLGADSTTVYSARYWEEIRLPVKLSWLMKVFYHAPITFCKYAWITFFYILIPKALVKTRYFLHFTLGFTIAGCIVAWVVTLTACDLSKLESSRFERDTCSPYLKPRVVGLVFGFHALSEVFVYSLPLFVIFRLRNLTVAQRVSSAIIFTLGFFCLFLMVFNVWLSSSLTPRFDFSYNHVVAVVFWPLEPAWAIIVTCLPAFRILLDQGWQNIQKRRYRNSGIEEKALRAGSPSDVESRIPEKAPSISLSLVSDDLIPQESVISRL